MNTGLIPDKTQLIEIIGARGYSDEREGGLRPEAHAAFDRRLVGL